MAAVDPLALGRDTQAEAVRLAEEAMAAQPTPTQEEVDRAKLGLNKVGDDGKRPTKAAPYATRDAKAD